MESYSAIKKNEILPLVGIWMDLIAVMPSIINWTEEEKEVCVALGQPVGLAASTGLLTQEQTGAAGMWPMAQEQGWLLLSLTWFRKSKAGGQWRCLTASPSLQPCHLHLGRGRRSYL